jgi:two-component system chemotaxis response regulator CheB
MIRVLLVDDSAVVRTAFARALAQVPDMKVVGEAPDPFVARDLILQVKPDVVVLDIEMPRMDGLTFLRKLMKHFPIPVVVCSSLSTRGGEVALDAMQSGACGVVCKPGPTQAPAATAAELIEAIRDASTARSMHIAAPVVAIAPPISTRGVPPPPSAARGPAAVHGASGKPAPHGGGAYRGDPRQILAIGASTGGTVAIERILSQLPPGMPPIVLAQHMPAYITKPFAARLNRVGHLEVREAVDGDELRPGLALLAPGGLHLLVEASGSTYRVRVKDGPLVSGHRPSVNVMFRSVALAARERAVGVILTGMGGDGAKGLVIMHDAGARTFAQDEATSVVFGMPKVAIELGAVDDVRGLPSMAAGIVAALERGPKGAVRAAG